MNTSDFNYMLPERLIAQSPLPLRSASRLMCLDKITGEVSHRNFRDFPGLLRPGDCLVLNDSRVLPARLIGKRNTGGAVEVVLLRDLGENRWECLTRPGKKTRPGAELEFGSEGELRAVVMETAEDGNRILEFKYEGIFLEILDRLGKMPLPPYIKEELDDRERYQTVFSREPGSAAAPTAGLHFTNEVLAEIRAMGVDIAYLTLHVGLGTFRPVKVESVLDHKMHSEFCIIPRETSEAVNRAKKQGNRVVAVGTTSCRTLESFAGADGMLEPGSGWTDIFIYPGYEFRCIDALLTNFHLPESTLIMLISALAGRENVLSAYNEAVREEYRFFSFGDAMLIV